MKKTFEILISYLLIITLMSCEKKEITVNYYPTEDIVNDTSSVVFDLDSLKMNFKEFDTILYELEEKKKQTIIEIIDDNILKKIKIISIGDGTIYNKNILSIENDSIVKEKNYPLSELKVIMKKHYFYYGKDENYSDSPDKALVIIYFNEDQKITDLKKYLILITRAFDELNNNQLMLHILISGIVPPPPPLTPPLN
ncbi:hypothetical protein [Flavobacterium lacus]|uniref:Lipoprotein n=1 Tax=Flavobacterium lacus TaxID=1353778 RepID=A0A328WYL1_9FLAO|nr:hypothetical protein [Flavobacterium lacus]RAR48994.1 hypothetical protein B0I10_104132 [Flavobacterium lacus]